jgi:hypothetical protein
MPRTFLVGAVGMNLLLAAFPRGYRSYARARRGGYGDSARTHRPMDSWDPYAKRWD